MTSRERIRERISNVDTAWLRMDRAENLMQIVGVMIFDGTMDYERLKRTIALRMLRYSRFQQIAEEDSEGAWWVDDDDFDIDTHVRHSLLPAPADLHELKRFVAEMASEPLNTARPRWEFHLVETASGDSALVARIHHAIGDGIALIGVMNSLTDDHADAPEDGGLRPPSKKKAARHTPHESESDDNDLFWRNILEPISEVALASLRMGGKLWDKSQGLREDPGKLIDYARMAASIAGEIGKLALMANDTKTRFKGKPGTVKCVAWSEPMSLVDIKAVGKVLGCSVNDMLLSSVAGALRAYLVDKGDPVCGAELRALVPVNLRAPGDIRKLGNRFGLVALELPVGIDNPLARVFETRARMEALKGSYQAMLTYTILGAVGMAPRFVQQQVLDLLASKATAVMTNVPGPQQERYFAGTRLKQQMFWVPQSGDVGMGVSILSYDGKVQFGLITDKSLVADPEHIVERFAGEFEKLLWLALMEPPERLCDPDAVADAVLEDDHQAQ